MSNQQENGKKFNNIVKALAEGDAPDAPDIPTTWQGVHDKVDELIEDLTGHALTMAESNKAHQARIEAKYDEQIDLLKERNRISEDMLNMLRSIFELFLGKDDA